MLLIMNKPFFSVDTATTTASEYPTFAKFMYAFM